MINIFPVSSNFESGYKSSTTYYLYYEKEDFFRSPLLGFGFYAGAGFDYHLKKDNALLFRIVYDNCHMQDWSGNSEMTTWHLKLGYTF